MSKKQKRKLTLMFLFDKSMYGTEKEMYIYIQTPFVLKEFIKQAEEENITFSDGTPILSHNGQQIYRFYPNGTVGSVSLLTTWGGAMKFYHSKDYNRIDYATYRSGDICCNNILHNSHVEPCPFHLMHSVNLFIDCKESTLQEKQDFYNFLIDKGFVSWTPFFVEANYMTVSLYNNIFSFDYDSYENGISIQNFYTIYNIFNKE